MNGYNESNQHVKSLGYKHIDHINHNNEKYKQIIDAVIEANPDFSRDDAINYLREQYSGFGINSDNYQWHATVTFEKGDGAAEVEEAVLKYFGKRFAKAFAEDESLRTALRSRLEGGSEGDIIDLSDFWAMAYKGMINHAAYNVNGNLVLAKLLEGHKLSGIQKFVAARELNDGVAHDHLAPPSERTHYSWRWAGDVLSAFGGIAAFTDIPLIGMTGRTRSMAGLFNIAAEEEMVTIYHATTRSSAWKIMKEGIRPGPDHAIFFAEDVTTATHFGKVAVKSRGIPGASSGTLMEIKVPKSIADKLFRGRIGEYRAVTRNPSIEGSTGHERILFEKDLEAFNQAIKNGDIKITTTKIGN